MNSPSSETLSTEDAVQTIGGRNTPGDKSESPGRRNEKSYARSVFNFQPSPSADLCPTPALGAICLRPEKLRQRFLPGAEEWLFRVEQEGFGWTRRLPWESGGGDRNGDRLPPGDAEDFPGALEPTGAAAVGEMIDSRGGRRFQQASRGLGQIRRVSQVVDFVRHHFDGVPFFG